MSITGWVVFNFVIVLILTLDLLVFHKKPRVIKLTEGLIWSGIFVCLALLFNIYVYFTLGKEAAINFLTGYIIEESLSIDNLFVFILIFSSFRTPASAMHKVLFWGILGAIICRAIFIFLGVALIQKFHPIIYVFGLFLIFTGIRFGFQKEKTISPEKNLIVRFFRFFFPVTRNYEKDQFFVQKRGRLFATPLFVVLLTIETTDVIFAIDSIPAVLAITYDPFIVYTSNIFAILGLRSLFFVLSGMINIFRYLQYGISIVLVFVGIKMLLSDLFEIPSLIALGVVLSILLGSILISILSGKRKISP